MTRNKCHPFCFMHVSRYLEKMTTPLRRVAALVVTLVVAFAINTVYSRRLLESHELLLGKWEADIKFPQSKTSCFPLKLRSILSFRQNRSFKNNYNNYHDGKPTTKREYSIHVFRNFTFLLQSKQVNNQNRSEPYCNDMVQYGHWKIHKNPYCPTDRFYDIVEFDFGHSLFGEKDSYYDCRHLYGTDGCSSTSINNHNSSARTVECSRMVARCRMTGHFSPGRLVPRARQSSRVPFAKGRLSHGVVEIISQQPHPKASSSGCKTDTTARFRIASFVGQRSIDSENTLYELDEAEDRRLFGY